jgi:hypothetical protein
LALQHHFQQNLVSHPGTDPDQPCIASEASQQWDAGWYYYMIPHVLFHSFDVFTIIVSETIRAKTLQHLITHSLHQTHTHTHVHDHLATMVYKQSNSKQISINQSVLCQHTFNTTQLNTHNPSAAVPDWSNTRTPGTGQRGSQSSLTDSDVTVPLGKEREK